MLMRVDQPRVDAGIAVGEGSLVLGFRGHPGALGREAGFKRFGISSGGRFPVKALAGLHGGPGAVTFARSVGFW